MTDNTKVCPFTQPMIALLISGGRLKDFQLADEGNEFLGAFFPDEQEIHCFMPAGQPQIGLLPEQRHLLHSTELQVAQQLVADGATLLGTAQLPDKPLMYILVKKGN